MLRWIKEVALLLLLAVLAGLGANMVRGEAFKLAWIGNYGSPEPSISVHQPIIASARIVPKPIEQPAPAGKVKIIERSKPMAGKIPRIESKPDSQAPLNSAARLRDIAPTKDPGAPFLEISGDIVRRLHAAGALFLDARRSSVYEAGHIPGARSIAVWEHDADAKIDALAKAGTPYDMIIVTYCSGGDCKDAETLAEKVSASGFFNVYLYTGGMPDWEKQDWPVQKGNKP